MMETIETLQKRKHVREKASQKSGVKRLTFEDSKEYKRVH
ncbi:hypothetical protein BC643_3287 [Mangrovibacterium diazotrophicum]|uniref:Uncharacterized protein n=1 Tax=Mangrovibacterium diazotrophicum TaxID=1261403 RepID=A0A419WBR4_9BACT|nr:hypothetical protein BC643_3287 [Mangrovibacterium diazotrophicum]